MSTFNIQPIENSRRSRGSLPPIEIDRFNVSSPDRATPDLDNALVSSEDEGEGIMSSKASSKPKASPSFSQVPRRSSFFNEVQNGPRIESKRKQSFTSFTPAINSSQPPTPSADTNINTWSFGTTLSKVPTTGSATAWVANARIWGSDASAGLRDAHEDLLPISIPLFPTPKTYRSQSYSVGQKDSDIDTGASHEGSVPGIPGLGRANQATIRHKPSKLNEVEHAHLFDLNEGEGEDESSDNGVSLDSPRFIDYHHGELPTSSPVTDAFSFTGLTDNLPNHNSPPIQSLANSNRPQWHTVDHLQEIPGSRRHSMADVTLGRGPLGPEVPPSLVSYTETHTTEGFRQQASNIEDNILQSDMNNRLWAQNYFAGNVPAARSQIEAVQHPLPLASMARELNPRSGAGAYRGGTPLFNRPGFDTPLYIVAFKCARADIYYVQPSTGLEINEGDLVMVEADRGYDLGTVTHARVSWAQARAYKESALDEHYRWLMMFSEHNQNIIATDPKAVQGMLHQTGPTERDPLQKGFGLGMQDPQYAQDIKPRMIKRRAFNYEIANLREKEGNEAKAKRSCQQKARDHGYKMEILDAEFQIDWKKLTFYFYAPDYVNFNPLVTELYKIYKVRIWMSAINPSTYPTPANKPPSLIGPGAMEGRDTPVDIGVAVNDPDPDGAIPPHLNPNSATYRELNKEAALRNQSSQEVFDPRSNVGYAQHPTDQRWGRNNQAPQAPKFPGFPGFAAPPSGAFSNQFSAQAAAGAHFTPSMGSPQPSLYGYNQGPAGPPGMTAPFQPWNSHQSQPQAHASSASRGPNRSLNPLAPPATLGSFGGLGGDWSRAFTNRSFGSNTNTEKKQ